MTIKKVSEIYSEDRTKKAIVNYHSDGYYFVDYFLNNDMVESIKYLDKSVHYVEDCAENYVMDTLNVSETA
jgi:hypothetical protein